MTDTTRRDSVIFDSARRIVDAFREECERRDVALSLAIVDVGGNIVMSCRMDDAQLGSHGVAVDKAYTAVAFGHPTSAWATSSTPGEGDWAFAHTLGGRTVVFPGGVPIFRDGHLIGGVGVSGTLGTVDEEIARAVIEIVGFAVAP